MNMTRTRVFFSLLGALGMALASAPHTAAAPPPGHILSSSGASYGGIIGFNSDGSNYINYTPDDATDLGRPQDKSEHPSISRDGSLMAFDSTRVAMPTGGDNAPHIFVMNSDGTGTRQITFKGTLGDGTPFRDFYPEMSPDGKEIAFVSNRGDQLDSGPSFPTNQYGGSKDIWVINTDGTNLHQVTFAQPLQSGQDTVYYSQVGGIAWGPDSHTLAFKGNRLSQTTPNQYTGVVGFVNDDGSGYRFLHDFGNTVNFRADVDAALDWSPNGRYIAAPYGDNNYYGALVIFDLTTSSTSSIPRKDSNGNVFQPFDASAGALRFSPDSTRLISDPDYNVQYIFNLDGTNQVVLNVPLNRSEPLCWAPGAAIAKPDHLSITPSPVFVAVGETVSLIPTLYDAQNNVIVHAVRAWNSNQGPSVFTISPTGSLTGVQNTTNNPSSITPDNAGITAASTNVVVGPHKTAPSWTAVSVAAGSDGKTRILWNKNDGSTTLWTLNPDGSAAMYSSVFGPFQGWTARAISVDPQNNTHILWTNVDGRMTLWTLDTNSQLTGSFPVFGPYNGWQAVGIASGPNGYTHILWDNSDGRMTPWTLDANNQLTGATPVYGPYSGWTAKAISVSPNNTAHILWDNADGRMTPWTLDANNQLTGSTPVYGPFAGWAAQSIGSGPDNNTHILWDNSDGRMTPWTLDTNNQPTGNFPVFGPYDGWSAQGIAEGPDGSSRILWDNVDGRMTPWTLTPNNQLTGNFPIYGPY